MQDSGHNDLALGGFEGEAVIGVRSNGKRIFARGFKEALVARCREPQVSVAALAMAHGINANLVRRWMVEMAPETPQETRSGKPAKPGAALIPVDVRAQDVRMQDVQTLDARVAMFEAPEKFPAHRPVRRPTQPPVQPTAPAAMSGIEIEAHGARVRLHGSIDAQRLGVVLEALARHAK